MVISGNSATQSPKFGAIGRTELPFHHRDGQGLFNGGQQSPRALANRLQRPHVSGKSPSPGGSAKDPSHREPASPKFQVASPSRRAPGDCGVRLASAKLPRSRRGTRLSEVILHEPSSCRKRTSIKGKFVEVDTFGRATSVCLDQAEAADISQSLLSCPGARSQKHGHHGRRLSLSLIEDGGASQVLRGVDSRLPEVYSMAKKFVATCFGLPVSRTEPVVLPAGWIAEEMPGHGIPLFCEIVRELVESQPTMVDVRAPCKVFGDIHGQFSDLLLFFGYFGQPQHYAGDIEAIEYLFLGDYVDRGPCSCETLLLLLSLKVLYPERIWLIRGNHEDEEINKMYGFETEVLAKYGVVDGPRILDAFHHVFAWLPLAALIEDRILCIHGGIGTAENDGEMMTLDDIQDCRRGFKSMTHDVDESGYPATQWATIARLLWTDPTADCSSGSHASWRVTATGDPVRDTRFQHIKSFGPEIVRRFCDYNDIDMIIRAHECVQKGFLPFAGGRLLTIFSARNYAGKYFNDGAFVLVTRVAVNELQVIPKVLTAADGIAEPKPVFMSQGIRDVSPLRRQEDYVGWSSSLDPYFTS